MPDVMNMKTKESILYKACLKVATWNESYTQIPEKLIREYGSDPLFVAVYNLRKESQTFAESIDNVREVLGLESTHYLIIADEVEDFIKDGPKRTAWLNARSAKKSNQG